MIQSYTDHGNKLWKAKSGTAIRCAPSYRMARVAEKKMEEASKDKEVSVADVLDLYLSRKQHRSKASDISRSNRLKQYLEAEPLARLSVGDIDEYRKAREGDLASPATIEKEVELLCRCARYALACGLIPHNPLHEVRLQHIANTRDTFFGPGVLDQIQSNLSGSAYLIFGIIRYTGMRPAEVYSLTREQIELTSYCAYITVRSTKSKTRQTRVVPLINPDILKILTGLCEKLAPSDYLFATKYGYLKSIRYDIQRAKAAAGVEGFWLYDLRRIFVTNLRRKGESETVIMSLTGHKTTSAFQRYSIVDPVDMLKALQR